jgi:hypothetical protein
MSERRCPKCRQAIVSCNDYVYCWRFGEDGCAMRGDTDDLVTTRADFDDEEDFLEWLFFDFLGLPDPDPLLVNVVDVPTAITITSQEEG